MNIDSDSYNLLPRACHGEVGHLRTNAWKLAQALDRIGNIADVTCFQNFCRVLDVFDLFLKTGSLDSGREWKMTGHMIRIQYLPESNGKNELSEDFVICL